MSRDGGERETRILVCVGEDLRRSVCGSDGLCVRRPMTSSLTSRPFGVVATAPCCVSGSTAPHGFPSSKLTSHSGVTCSRLSVVIGDAESSLNASSRTAPRSCAARRRALEPVALHRRAAEHALFDGELGDVEVRAVAQQRKENAAEAMGDRDDGHLVAALRAQAGGGRVEGGSLGAGLGGGRPPTGGPRRRGALWGVGGGGPDAAAPGGGAGGVSPRPAPPPAFCGGARGPPRAAGA